MVTMTMAVTVVMTVTVAVTVVMTVTVAAAAAVLHLVLDGVGDDGAAHGAQHRLELAALADLAAQGAAARPAEDGGHQALFAFLFAWLLLLLLLLV